jgi:hypothetical protein
MSFQPPYDRHQQEVQQEGQRQGNRKVLCLMQEPHEGKEKQTGHGSGSQVWMT